jgi:hypothetical protein
MWYQKNETLDEMKRTAVKAQIGTFALACAAVSTCAPVVGGIVAAGSACVIGATRSVKKNILDNIPLVAKQPVGGGMEYVPVVDEGIERALLAYMAAEELDVRRWPRVAKEKLKTWIQEERVESKRYDARVEAGEADTVLPPRDLPQIHTFPALHPPVDLWALQVFEHVLRNGNPYANAIWRANNSVDTEVNNHPGVARRC